MAGGGLRTSVPFAAFGGLPPEIELKRMRLLCFGLRCATVAPYWVALSAAPLSVFVLVFCRVLGAQGLRRHSVGSVSCFICCRGRLGDTCRERH